MERSFYICECESLEHFFTVLYDFDEVYPNAYVSVHLSDLPFWKRLRLGIKYILGYKTKYGHFDEIVLSPQELRRLGDECLQAYHIMTSHGKKPS